MPKESDGGPAFADGGSTSATGVSVRDYFATAALQGMLSSAPMTDRANVDKAKWTQGAYLWADAMLAARGETE